MTDETDGSRQNEGDAGAIAESNAESGFAVRDFAADDLGSTADDFGLTSGGTGTAIDERVLMGDESAPSPLGMGMDNSTDMIPGAEAPPLDEEPTDY